MAKQISLIIIYTKYITGHDRYVSLTKQQHCSKTCVKFWQVKASLIQFPFRMVWKKKEDFYNYFHISFRISEVQENREDFWVGHINFWSMWMLFRSRNTMKGTKGLLVTKKI
jgi:hypothetical protein